MDVGYKPKGGLGEQEWRNGGALSARNYRNQGRFVRLAPRERSLEDSFRFLDQRAIRSQRLPNNRDKAANTDGTRPDEKEERNVNEK